VKWCSKGQRAVAGVLRGVRPQWNSWTALAWLPRRTGTTRGVILALRGKENVG